MPIVTYLSQCSTVNFQKVQVLVQEADGEIIKNTCCPLCLLTVIVLQLRLVLLTHYKDIMHWGVSNLQREVSAVP